MPDNVYENLRELLDTHPVGCAPAPEMIEILKMAGIVQSRNFLNFNDGGVSFTVNDKAQDYLQWIQTLVSTHAQDVNDLKVGLNAEEGYAHIPSPEDYWFYGGEDFS